MVRPAEIYRARCVLSSVPRVARIEASLRGSSRAREPGTQAGINGAGVLKEAGGAGHTEGTWLQSARREPFRG